MKRAAAFLIVGAVVSSALAATHDSAACSCGMPRLRVVSVPPALNAPLSTRVRIDRPDPTRMNGSRPRMVLRGPAGVEIATANRTLTFARYMVMEELTPQAPLTPMTKYEIAAVDPSAHPSVTVAAAFTTGSSSDNTPPRLDKIGSVTVHHNPAPVTTMCETAGPWVKIDGIVAQDPGRPEASLVVVAWRADSAGKIDTSHAPIATRAASEGSLFVGRASVCDPYGEDLPPAGMLHLGIAAIDESGNQSPVQKLKVDLAKSTPVPSSPSP